MPQSKKIQLKGHETFILRDGWITKGLFAVAENRNVFADKSGADALGVGTNMAKAVRYWMKESGLLSTDKKENGLSNLGKVILEKDPYVEDPFTLWILHVNLAMNAANVTSWYVFLIYWNQKNLPEMN